jgi:trans-L-3-hydroxyproline dehydratase
MWEPRGHADMYGCVLTPPVTPDGDVGVLFMHNEGWSTMCGHGIIALASVGLETGLIAPRDARADDVQTVRIDTPAGRVTAAARWRGERVAEVAFRNVPSFLMERDLTLAVHGVGDVTCDIAFGGAFYAYVDAEELGVAVTPANVGRLVELGMRIKHEVMNDFEIRHPGGEADLGFLYGTIIVERPDGGIARTRNVCVFAEGEVDRSPTGTGVSGRVAIHHARGELTLGEPIVVESIIGSTFTGRAVEETRVGAQRAVIPEVTGTASITGRHEFLVDPDDPLGGGFLVR